MTSSGKGKLAKGFASIMLAICSVAAGIYFTDWSNNHPHILAIIIAVSLSIAALLGLWGFTVDSGREETVLPSHSTSGQIHTMGNNNAPQVSGNSGHIHIGNIHHAQVQSPQLPQRDFRDEWLKLADKMKENCHFLRADWSMNNILGETWHVAGGERNMCQAWMRQAGAMLLVSPRVRGQLSKAVAEDPNDLERWLRYLKERYIFKWDGYAYGQEPDPETGITETIHMGSVPNLSEQSAKACIDCSTLELR